MPFNTAAWLTAEKANPLEVKEAPYTSPKANEILIKNKAVAVNPVDWGIQSLGSALFSWLKYPAILGTDVAGEVVEIGDSVTRFRISDRVLGYAHALSNDENDFSGSGFQKYTILSTNLVSHIPDQLSFECACVIPMSISVGACALFEKKMLALEFPTLSPKSTGKTVLIWGGATSMGCSAIQLAVSAGYEVISTSSPKNFNLVKRLGASQVFDYSSPTIINDLVDAFHGKTCAGGIAIGNAASMFGGIAESCVEVVSKVEGVKFVACTMPVPENLSTEVEAKFVLAGSVRDTEVGRMIYEGFLPKALVEGKFVASPEPLIVGKGLGFIQEALEVQKAGVSAKKVVVSL